MRANKRAVYATGIIAVLSFVVCWILRIRKPFWYDISLACFGSALLGVVVAYTAYSAERRDAMELFWSEAFRLSKQIRAIEHFVLYEPADLVRDCLAEEYGHHIMELNTHEAKDKLKTWISENQHPDDGLSEYEGALELYYQGLIKDYKQRLIKVIQSYIVFSEESVNELGNYYSRMDFLVANHAIRIDAYQNIYRRIFDFQISCREEVYHFKHAVKNNGYLGVCLGKVQMLDQVLYSEINGKIFSSFADLLDQELEIFRSKIYGEQPKTIVPAPINMIDFENPVTSKKNIESVHAETTKYSI